MHVCFIGAGVYAVHMPSLPLSGLTSPLPTLRARICLDIAQDNTLRVWDTRAFCEGDRCRVVMGVSAYVTVWGVGHVCVCAHTHT